MKRVSFPPGTLRCRAGVGLSFRVRLDDSLVVCEVAREALTQMFGAESENCDALIDAFERHRERIETVTRALLEGQDDHERLRLTETHFQDLSEA